MVMALVGWMIPTIFVEQRVSKAEISYFRAVGIRFGLIIDNENESFFIYFEKIFARE
jgi:hypothetical protein